MNHTAELSVKGFRQTRLCRGVARFLIFAMLIYGTPFQQLIQSYQWNPRPLWDTLRGITDFISPRAAHAFTIDHYLGYKV